MKTLEFDGILVTVIRSDRKTVAIQIKSDGVFVRAPRRMGDGEIFGFLEKRSAWIHKHLQEMTARNALATQLQPFTDDELRMLAQKAAEYIPKRVQYYAKLIGVDYGRITIRCQRTRWGSCSSKGNLNFNCLLMLFPNDVIDSVVVHELCHRKHMNHSAKFYAEIEKVFPKHESCRKWLKENGGTYLSRLP